MNTDPTACQDLAVLVTLRAAGALEPDDEARVEAHLAGCAACRAEAERDAALLGLASLPPASEPVRRAVAEVPARAAAQVHRAARRRTTITRRLAATGVAVAAAAVLLAPAFLWRGPPIEIPRAEIAWEEPDLATIWEDTQVLELDAAAEESGVVEDAAYAALEVGETDG